VITAIGTFLGLKYGIGKLFSSFEFSALTLVGKVANLLSTSISLKMAERSEA